MEYWHSWEILERTVDEIEVVARPAHARIGMEAWKNWVAKPLCHQGNGRDIDEDT